MTKIGKYEIYIIITLFVTLILVQNTKKDTVAIYEENNLNSVEATPIKNYLATYIDNEEIDFNSQIEDLTSLLASVTNDVSNEVTNSNNTKTFLSNLNDKTKSNNIFLRTYPVGSIYISYSSTNPGTIFGGTWEAFGAGRTLVGINTSDTDFNSVGKTGGEKTHTLTVAEMPSHTHTFTGSGHSHQPSNTTTKFIGVYEGNNVLLNGTARAYWSYSGTASFHPMFVTHATYNSDVAIYEPATTNSVTTSGTNSNTGSGSAHNNMQPYITVYMWKRTA